MSAILTTVWSDGRGSRPKLEARSAKWDTRLRRERNRSHLRCASDLTDGEWLIVAPLLPPPRRGGRPRAVDMRNILNAILFFLSGACAWEDLPNQYPPKSTVYDYFTQWRSDRTLVQVHVVLWEPSGIADARCSQVR